MPNNKLIESMKKYVFNSYVGKSDNFFGRIWCALKARYWTYKFQFMTEGDIMDRYYELTTRTEEMDLCHRN